MNSYHEAKNVFIRHFRTISLTLSDDALAFARAMELVTLMMCQLSISIFICLWPWDNMLELLFTTSSSTRQGLNRT